MCNLLQLGFFHSAWRLWNSSKLLHASVVNSFWLLNNIPLYGCPRVYLFTCGKPFEFTPLFLMIMNSAAINTHSGHLDISPPITARNKLLCMPQPSVQTSPPLRSLLNATASNNASSQSSLTALLTQPACLLPLFSQHLMLRVWLSPVLTRDWLALKWAWSSTSQHCPRQTPAPYPPPTTLGNKWMNELTPMSRNEMLHHYGSKLRTMWTEPK